MFMNYKIAKNNNKKKKPQEDYITAVKDRTVTSSNRVSKEYSDINSV